MNGFRKWGIAAIVVASLAACGQNDGSAPEKVQSVDYYKANQSERVATLERCRNSPGTVGLTPNCVNARAADTSSRLDSGQGVKTPAPLKPN